MTEPKRRLTKLTVNLVPNAVDAMEHAAAIKRDSKTDTVNRALQLYDMLVTETTKGKEILLRDQAGGVERITIL